MSHETHKPDCPVSLHEVALKSGYSVVAAWPRCNCAASPPAADTGRLIEDEFAFRLNDGNVKRPTFDRLDSFIDGMAQKRLTYKALIQ